MARLYKGQKVTNSGRRLRIEVTAKDIDNGEPLEPDNCAAAQSIMRLTGANDVAVHRGVVLIQQKEGGSYQKFMTSSALRLETIVFDRGGQFIAGEYDLKPVPVRLIAPRKKSPSAPRTTKQMNLATRRRVIPGVRRTARSTTEENEE
jgi:hypothetical protein